MPKDTFKTRLEIAKKKALKRNPNTKKIMSVYMLNIRLREAQAELDNATDQDAVDRANLRISHIRDAIRDVESIEWHGRGWRSRERNA